MVHINALIFVICIAFWIRLVLLRFNKDYIYEFKRISIVGSIELQQNHKIRSNRSAKLQTNNIPNIIHSENAISREYV